MECRFCRRSFPNLPAFTKGGYEIVRCPFCGTGATLFDDLEAIKNIYNAGYFSGGREDGYLNYEMSEPVLRKEFRSTLRRLANAGFTQGRLLEIGAANGFFLTEAQQSFNCEGIEISKEAVEFCRKRNLAVTQASVDETTLDKETYDVAVMLDTIEHLPQPRAALLKIHGALKKGGALLLTTGDWNSWLSRLSGKQWRLLTPPQHLFFFTKHALTSVLEELGFKIENVSRPWKWVPLGLALYQLLRKTGWKRRVPNWLNEIAIPINLFDTVCILAIKK